MQYSHTNWKKYIKEEKEHFPYQIFCDMDGVLVDFVSGAVNAINEAIKYPLPHADSTTYTNMINILQGSYITARDLDMSKKDEMNIKLVRKFMYKILSNNKEFWTKLGWQPGGKDLWAYIAKYNPYILTAPMEEASVEGKKVWIAQNLMPSPEKNFFSHEKYNWAVSSSGRPNVLIDDFKTNTEPWESAGGIAILHKSTEETIESLEAIKNGR